MTTRAILDLLRDINERLGITIVVITHEMEVIRQICQKVSIIDGGRIVESGAVSELFSRPQSEAGRRMFRSAMKHFSELPTGRLVRVIFDGAEVYEPVIANLIIEQGAPVSIISAQMDTVAGETRGQLVLQLPEDPALSGRMIESLRRHSLTVEEVA
jgi:D-methionine transport system ATP-binding protein